MFDEGFQNITNIDISQTVTKAMQDKYKDKGPGLKCNWECEKKKNGSRSPNGCSCDGVSGRKF